MTNKKALKLCNFKTLACLRGFEPPANGLEIRCSIQLSYRHILNLVERVMGIGPTQSAWKADVLPLNYTRKLETRHQAPDTRYWIQDTYLTTLRLLLYGLFTKFTVPNKSHVSVSGLWSLILVWSGIRDSDSRLSPWQGDTLPLS